MRELYRLENLRRCYSGKTVLDIDSLSIFPSRIVGLRGPNGAGKSTLLRILAFLEFPDSGRLLYNDTVIRPSDSIQARREVTLMTQDSYLLRRSVEANVGYGLKVRGLGPDQERVNSALLAVGLEPERFRRRLWFQLSGGEARRAAMAARLAVRPRVLLMDEPTANLDEESTQRIRTAALKAKEQGTALVIASHDQDWLTSVCDGMIQLGEGRILDTSC